MTKTQQERIQSLRAKCRAQKRELDGMKKQAAKFSADIEQWAATIGASIESMNFGIAKREADIIIDNCRVFRKRIGGEP